MTVTVLDVVQELVTKHNIEVVVKTHLHNELVFDVQTKTKSHLYIDPTGKCITRYDEPTQLNLDQSMEDVIKDLAELVNTCICGRLFINENWFKLINEVVGEVDLGTL